MTQLIDLDKIVSEVIQPKKKIAIGGGAMLLKPMEAIREIIRQEKKDLHVITLIGDLDIDLLVGVGAISELHSSYVGLPMIGMAGNFRRVLEQEKTLTFHEWSECSMIRAFQGGAIGLPFVLIRTILGSDLVKIRPDFEEVTFQGKKYVQVPSIFPDIAIIHAYAADSNGNVYYPKNHILDAFSTLPALCSDQLFVTVEKMITREEAREITDRLMFSYLDVDYISVVPNGAWPSGFPPFYASDMGHLMTYSGISRNPDGFQTYLEENVLKQEGSQ
ncbi:MAG: CoA transferase subunit A [Candidatus Heimdallarchaeota archaeon]|nr:MAG: CoA transferase subunit A [Candidatus Heimdallarchaeota archaeon]